MLILRAPWKIMLGLIFEETLNLGSFVWINMSGSSDYNAVTNKYHQEDCPGPVLQQGEVHHHLGLWATLDHQEDWPGPVLEQREVHYRLGLWATLNLEVEASAPSQPNQLDYHFEPSKYSRKNTWGVTSDLINKSPCSSWRIVDIVLIHGKDIALVHLEVWLSYRFYFDMSPSANYYPGYRLGWESRNGESDPRATGFCAGCP